MAICSLTEGLLKKGQDLQVLMIETHKHPFIQDAFPQGLLERSKARSVFVETKLDPVDAFTSLVNRDPYNVSRFFSPDFDHALVDMLNEDPPEVVQLESLFMAPYIDTVRKFSNAKVVLRSHNLEHRIWQRVAKRTRHLLKKAYLSLLSQQLRKYEEKVLSDIDGLVSISDQDRKNFERMGLLAPSISIPFGLNTEHWSPGKMEKGRSRHFFHLGSMDWIPNQEAVDQLLNEIWPIVRKELPDAELSLIGKNMDRGPEDVPDGVHVIGEVNDAVEAIRENGIMLVPLRSGSGIRVRIIQGMALEKAIVSTRMGASGIEVSDRKELLIAEDPEEFARAMIELAGNPDLREKVGMNARTTVLERYDGDRLAGQLSDFYTELAEAVP